jgi:hypothetical protein
MPGKKIAGIDFDVSLCFFLFAISTYFQISATNHDKKIIRSVLTFVFSILASIDDTFNKIEPIFSQIAEKLGPHPQTRVDSVLVLPNEDALDVYTRLASNTPLPGMPFVLLSLPFISFPCLFLFLLHYFINNLKLPTLLEGMEAVVGCLTLSSPLLFLFIFIILMANSIFLFSKVPTSPDWLWSPFQDPAMVVMTEKLDFVVRLLSCLTSRPPNLPYPTGNSGELYIVR